MSKLQNIFNQLPIIRNIRALSFKIHPPGFRGISLGEVFNFYLNAMKDSSVFERAYSASFKFFMALFPGVIFLITLIPFLPFENFHKQILTTLEDFIPWQIFQLVEQTFIDVIKRKNSGLLSLGFFIAMFFTTNGMNGLMRAFNDSALITYNVKRFKQRLKAMALTFFMIFILIVTVLFIVTTSKYFYQFYKSGYISSTIYNILLLSKWVVLFCILYLSIATIFYFSPSRKIRHSFFSPGALASTFCIIIFTFLFSHYIDNFSNYNKIYGILGTFPLLLVWIFLNVLSMLIGFELNISIITALKNKTEQLIRIEPEAQNRFKWEKWKKNSKWIPCENEINQIPDAVIDSFKHRLVLERLENKTRFIYQDLLNNNENWEQTFYEYLARNFGFKVNSLPFYLLAKSIPISVIHKYKDQLPILEALFLGQSGMLDSNFDDVYLLKLKKEYGYLKKAYNLETMDASIWKFSKMRPSNFPTIRIAQFAQLLHQSTSLFSKIIHIENIKDAEKLFQISLHSFWNNHFVLDSESISTPKKFGKSSIQNILINTIIPFMFLFGKQRDNIELVDKSIYLLEEISAEENIVTKKWKELNIKSKNAFDSQALIHLKNSYCQYKMCLNCVIGNKLFKNLSLSHS